MTGFNPFNEQKIQQPIKETVQATTHNNPQPQQEITPPTPPTPTNNNQPITKTVCATEIMKWLKKTKTLGMVAIIGYLVSAAGSIFGVMGSTILSLGFIGFSAWILASTQKEIKRLRDTYGIQ